LGNDIELRFMQSLKQYSPIESTEDEPMWKESKLEQFLKAITPNVVPDEGRKVTVRRLEQSPKAFSPMEVPEEARKTIDFRLSEFIKASRPIEVNEEGKTRESILLPPIKHSSPMEVTEGDIIFNFVKLGHDTKACFLILVPAEG
jgi:hypothetical protein